MGVFQRSGFFSLEHDHWRPWATPPEVAKQRVVNMFSDSSGRIWVSTYEGDIITMDKGTVVDYPVKPDTPCAMSRPSPSMLPSRSGRAVQVVWL